MANKTASSKQKSFGTTMGVSSIIAILVLIVLIVFAALSIMTSKADLTLAQKTANTITAYYEADNKAEERLSEISKAVKAGGNWQESLSGEDITFSTTESGTEVSYRVVVNEDLTLLVTLHVSNAGEISRKEWHLTSLTEWAPDNGLSVMQ
ncbi:MAG: hypothetical protein LBU41_05435 [Clostridiales Family XIII bacterium]|jgi:predicted PurR-regulated permease PerM|nr:hypothetical protein [Clostridiales Family XIII bacterium]